MELLKKLAVVYLKVPHPGPAAGHHCRTLIGPSLPHWEMAVSRFSTAIASPGMTLWGGGAMGTGVT
jgi:hypothetical protein